MQVKLESTSVIKAKLGLNNNGRVQQYFTKACAEHMDKYVPLDSGGLAYDNRHILPDKIIYESPYAHYMYEGKVMGPNIPIKENGVIIGWFSKSPKYYTGKDIDYSKSIARGHDYAGPHWDQRMWTAEKNEVIKETENYMKRGG